MTAARRQPPKETIGMSRRSVFTVGAAVYLTPDLQFSSCIVETCREDRRIRAANIRFGS
jgi:hypothetical protein